MTTIISPIPFAIWGIDIVGKLPACKGQFTHAIVAVDYFSKWVEARAVTGITCQDVKNFLWKNIITRYGIPRIIVTDNGTQFEGAPIDELCQRLHIRHHFSPVCYPQANGQVEVMNRTIFTGIKKNLQDSRNQWPEELHRVLWSYRTTPSSATGHTPFSLVYGTEAIIPVEVGLPSMRMRGFDEELNNSRMREHLDLADELRDQALYKMVKYKQLMSRFYNRRVRTRQFREGDLVLRVLKSSQPTTHKKLGPRWEGPYRVKQVKGKGSYELEHLDGKPISRTWHAANLKKIYV